MTIALAKIYQQYKRKKHPHPLDTILENDRETIVLFTMIQADLEEPSPYDKVLVYGFSFGGAMVNEVSLKFHELENTTRPYPKLEMATFGSVFLTYGANEVDSVEVNKEGCHTLVNYMAKEDVVLTVNNFNEHYKQYPFPSDMNKGKELLDHKGKVYLRYIPVTTPDVPLDLQPRVPLALQPRVPPRVQPICIKECQQMFRSGWTVHFGYGKLFYELLNRTSVNIEDLPLQLPPRTRKDDENEHNLVIAVEHDDFLTTKSPEEPASLLTHDETGNANPVVSSTETDENAVTISNHETPVGLPLQDSVNKKLIKDILDGKPPERGNVPFAAYGKVEDSLRRAFTRRYITKSKLEHEMKLLEKIGFANCTKKTTCMDQANQLIALHKRNNWRYSKFWRPWFTKKIIESEGGRKSKRQKLRRRTVNQKRR